jgi:hypothetical protein
MERVLLVMPREAVEDRLGPAAQALCLNFEAGVFLEAEKSSKEFEDLVDRIRNSKEAAESLTVVLKEKYVRMEVFLEALLSVMRCSVDHLVKLLERYEKVFRYYRSEPRYEKKLLDCLFGCFPHSTIQLALFLEKMVAVEALQLSAYGRWVVERLDEGVPLFEEYRMARVWAIVLPRLGDEDEKVKVCTEEIRAKRLKIRKD